MVIKSSFLGHGRPGRYGDYLHRPRHIHDLMRSPVAEVLTESVTKARNILKPHTGTHVRMFWGFLKGILDQRAITHNLEGRSDIVISSSVLNKNETHTRKDYVDLLYQIYARGDFEPSRIVTALDRHFDFAMRKVFAIILLVEAEASNYQGVMRASELLDGFDAWHTAILRKTFDAKGNRQRKLKKVHEKNKKSSELRDEFIALKAVEMRSDKRSKRQKSEVIGKLPEIRLTGRQVLRILERKGIAL